MTSPPPCTHRFLATGNDGRKLMWRFMPGAPADLKHVSLKRRCAALRSACKNVCCADAYVSMRVGATGALVLPL